MEYTSPSFILSHAKGLCRIILKKNKIPGEKYYVFVIFLKFDKIRHSLASRPYIMQCTVTILQPVVQ